MKKYGYKYDVKAVLLSCKEKHLADYYVGYVFASNIRPADGKNDKNEPKYIENADEIKVNTEKLLKLGLPKYFSEHVFD